MMASSAAGDGELDVPGHVLEALADRLLVLGDRQRLHRLGVEVGDLAADVVGQAVDREGADLADAPRPSASDDQNGSAPMPEGGDEAQSGDDHSAFGSGAWGTRPLSSGSVAVDRALDRPARDSRSSLGRSGQPGPAGAVGGRPLALGQGRRPPGPGLGLGQVEDAEELLGEDEVLGPEDLVRPRVVQVGEDDLDVGEQLAFEERLGLDDGPLGPEVGQRHLVDELVARRRRRRRTRRRGIFARTTFSANPPASPTRIPPVCASPSMISEAGITG